MVVLVVTLTTTNNENRYIVCRREKSPLLLLDFADLLQINVFVLGASKRFTFFLFSSFFSSFHLVFLFLLSFNVWIYTSRNMREHTLTLSHSFLSHTHTFLAHLLHTSHSLSLFFFSFSSICHPVPTYTHSHSSPITCTGSVFMRLVRVLSLNLPLVDPSIFIPRYNKTLCRFFPPFPPFPPPPPPPPDCFSCIPVALIIFIFF
jgi:hypothetical protein